MAFRLSHFGISPTYKRVSEEEKEEEANFCESPGNRMNLCEKLAKRV